MQLTKSLKNFRFGKTEVLSTAAHTVLLSFSLRAFLLKICQQKLVRRIQIVSES